ncbi:MAG TPA: hypothetical protein VFQ91_09035 [Bryobacteraceae bacterium]|nr:hypothetical protein [Bryobacteraceae bacterium]
MEVEFEQPDYALYQLPACARDRTMETRGLASGGAGRTFFSVFQRPQEAVVWYAALPELLVFTFVLGGLLCWLRFLDEPRARWYAATFGCFLLGLLSKESGVVLAPLALATAWVERRRLLPAVPFFLVSGVFFGLAHAARAQHLHFNDGTFSMTAPFLTTAAQSIWRLFWVWGLIAMAALWIARRRFELPWFAGALAWMFIVLLPYSFLTYQNSVPSRHTYLASAGVAFLAGRAYATWKERLPERRGWITAVGALCLLSQVVTCGSTNIRNTWNEHGPPRSWSGRCRNTGARWTWHVFPIQ